jgi:glutathione S-transferase
MTATLYGIPGSHAVKAGELMLEHKGIEFRRRDFPPGLHRVVVRVLGFRGDRVPAVRFDDGSRAQGTRELPRVLDRMVPERPLVPDDPRGLEAEAWADDVLQQWARRIAAATGAKNRWPAAAPTVAWACCSPRSSRPAGQSPAEC